MYQDAIAADPLSTYKGYLLGGMAWFSQKQNCLLLYQIYSCSTRLEYVLRQFLSESNRKIKKC